MMKLINILFNTLRARVISLVVGVIVLISIITLLFVQDEIQLTFYRTNDYYSQNLVNYLSFSVSNQYKSIRFHEHTVLSLKKQCLKDHIEIALQTLQSLYEKQLRGELSEYDAQRIAKVEISNLRFDQSVGYFWINDMQKPYPKMIMHPTLPELDGKILDDEHFNCALGKSENLFRAAVQVCERNSEGYIDYFWPKPFEGGLSEDQPKLSFVKEFKPWNWVIGCGVYIDDIESETNNRVEAVIDELNEGLNALTNDFNGYVFIFSGDNELLVHPYMRGRDLSKSINSISENYLVEDFVNGYKKGNNYIDYYWAKAADTVNYTHLKRGYISYFEPLDWYIVATYYIEEINEPIKSLSRKIVLLTIVLLAVFIALSVVIVNTLTKPIHELSKEVIHIEKEGIPETIRHIKGTYEIESFRDALNTMIASVKVSQEELLSSKTKLQQYLEFAPDAIFIIDAESNILSCNKQAVSVLKTENAVSSKAKLKDFVHKDDIVNFASSIEDIFEHGVAENEVSFTNSKGEIVYTLFSGSLLATGEIISFVKDIGQIKSYQNELCEAKLQAEESNKLKSAFLANMSHEIRTPMNGVVGFTQLISDPELSNEERMYYSEIISRSSMQLLSIVNDIVDISKIEAGLIDLDIEDIVIDEFLNRIKESHIQKAESAGLNINVEIDKGDLITIKCDSTKLRQIIDNLVSNAIKFTEEGSVTIGYKWNEGQSLFFVADTGIGLSPSDQEIIFDRFTQAKRSSATNKGGTGLGLAISKAFVDLMEGEIWVESEVDKGATFYFTISDKI